MSNKITIVTDKKGHKIVQINEIIFKGKQNIDWKSVEKYAKKSSLDHRNGHYVGVTGGSAVADEALGPDRHRILC